jgi:hypothetical protein
MQASLPLAAPNGFDEQVERAMTLDLAVLAQVERGDRIEVERVADQTIELFARTIRILEDHHRPGPGETEPFIGPPPASSPNSSIYASASCSPRRSAVIRRCTTS